MKSTTANRFFIHNRTGKALMINVEPEAMLYSLADDEEVTVRDEFIKKPVTLRLTHGNDNEVVISVWPGDGEVVVEKDGENVLDLVAASGTRTD